MAVATDQQLPQYLARAMPLRGWARAACGPREEGITEIQQGLTARQATGGPGTARITWPSSPRCTPREDRRPRGWKRWPKRW